MGACDQPTNNNMSSSFVDTVPSEATSYATCTGNQESCDVELLVADRMTANNLSLVKCTQSGTNTARAYSVQYTDTMQTGVQTINVLQDTLVVTATQPGANALSLDTAIVGDLKTFQYNGVCALEESDIRVVSENSSGVRLACVPFTISGGTSKPVDGCRYSCGGGANINVNVFVSEVCSAHLPSLSPGVTLVLRGQCDNLEEDGCTCSIETPPYLNTTTTPDDLPQPRMYYALS